MINERGRHFWRPILAVLRRFCSAQSGGILRSGSEETMTSEMTAFAIAVGATSLVCYLLMTRVQNGRRNRRSSGDGSAPDVANYGGGGGGTLSSWFGCGYSALYRSRNPGDSSCFPSGRGFGRC